MELPLLLNKEQKFHFCPSTDTERGFPLDRDLKVVVEFQHMVTDQVDVEGLTEQQWSSRDLDQFESDKKKKKTQKTVNEKQ